MIIAHSPKDQFMALEDTARAFRTMASGNVLPVAITHALAQLAESPVATPEALMGARVFINILLNLGEAPEPKSNYPDKMLTPTPSGRTPPKPKPKEKS